MKKSSTFITPPVLAEWLLKKINTNERSVTFLGDLAEVYNDIIEESGIIKAKLWYWAQILNCIQSIIENTITGSAAMLKNYIKIAFRNILKNKVYSLIHISGLALGLSACILVLLYINYEYSLDKFHENYEQIYRIDRKEVLKNGYKSWIDVSEQTGQWLVEDIPSIVNFARFKSLPFYNSKVSYKERQFKTSLIESVDPSLFDIFTFPLSKGQPETIFINPNSAILTQEYAAILFGKSNPIGETITITADVGDAKVEYNLEVTGILNNIPENSSFDFNMLVPMDLCRKIHSEKLFQDEDFTKSGFVTYLLLNDKADPQQLEQNLENFVTDRYGENRSGLTILSLKSIKEIFSEYSAIYYMTLFSIFAFIILLVACINYMNLSTARSFTRAKEIGIRKVIGAKKPQLILQFIGETLILAVFGLVAAYFIAKLFLPAFNTLLDKNITFDLINTSAIFGRTIFITLAVGILAGLYPALFLANIKPVSALKGKLKFEHKLMSLRNIMVVFQYTISIFFIVGTLVINKQHSHMTQNELGFEKDDVLIITLDESQPFEFMQNIKSRLTNIRNVEHVSYATSIPYESHRRLPKEQPVLKPEHFMSKATGQPIVYCDPDYFSVLGIEMESGVGFSNEGVLEKSNSLVLSSNAIHLIDNVETIIPGQSINIRTDESRYKDFLVKGVTNPIQFTVRYFANEPLFFAVGSPGHYIRYKYLLVKSISNLNEKLAAEISGSIADFSPESEFKYTYLDDDINSSYSKEDRWQFIFSTISWIAIFVTSLGMIGISTYSCQQRVQEVGIRKVLGSTVSGIIGLLTRQHVALVVIANSIGIPLGVFYMNNYLTRFAYQIDIGLDTILTSFSISMVLTLITITFQVYRTAAANPVESLRYE